MQIIIRPLVTAMFLAAGIGIAAAQTQGGTAGVSPHQGAGANTHLPQSGPPTGGGSLSHELNRSGGVIRPPPTHDRGAIAPPNPGVSRTPIIPPPGTPGGNPNLRPK